MDRVPVGYAATGVTGSPQLAPFATGDIATGPGPGGVLSPTGPGTEGDTGEPGPTGPLDISGIVGPTGASGSSGLITGPTGMQAIKKAVVLSQQRGVSTNLLYKVLAGTMDQDGAALRVTTYGRNSSGVARTANFAFSGLGAVASRSIPNGGIFRFKVLMMRSGGGDVKIMTNVGWFPGKTFIYAVGFIGGWFTFDHTMQMSWSGAGATVDYMLVEHLTD